MALGTDHYSFADVDFSVPEIWGERINDAFLRKLKLAGFFTERSDELLGGGDTIYTTNTSTYATNAKANGSEVTLQSPTLAGATLVVSTWREASLLFEDREWKQMKQSAALQESFFVGLAHAAGKELDDAIAALFSGFSSTVGASTANVTQAVLMEAIATAQTNSEMDVTDVDGWAFFFHPYTAYTQIGNLDNYVRYDATNTTSPVTGNFLYSILGIPVMITTAAPNVSGTSGRYNMLSHKNAIHWARLPFEVPNGMSGYVGEAGVRVMESYNHEYMGMLISADICYGVIENRDELGVQILSHATFAS